MNDAELVRIQNDLATVRRAAGFERPYTRDDVWMHLLWGAAGVALAVAALFLPASMLRGAVLVLLAGVAWGAHAVRRRQANQPARWREHRMLLIAALIVAPVVWVYMQWEHGLGVPRTVVGASAVFFAGVAMCLFGVIDRTRRHWLGSGVPLMVLGLALPALELRGVVVAAGCTIATAGLLTAALLTWQLRDVEPADAAD